MEEGCWVPEGKKRGGEGVVPSREPGLGSKAGQHIGRVQWSLSWEMAGSFLRCFPSDFGFTATRRSTIMVLRTWPTPNRVSSFESQASNAMLYVVSGMTLLPQSYRVVARRNRSTLVLRGSDESTRRYLWRNGLHRQRMT